MFKRVDYPQFQAKPEKPDAISPPNTRSWSAGRSHRATPTTRPTRATSPASRPGGNAARS